MEEYITPVFYLPPSGIPKYTYPSAVAVGGRAAGTILPASSAPTQTVCIAQPLPPPCNTEIPKTGIITHHETYEFCDLRLGENLFIPFWKPYGMPDKEALSELFRGYFHGKKAEARKRKAV